MSDSEAIVQGIVNLAKAHWTLDSGLWTLDSGLGCHLTANTKKLTIMNFSCRTATGRIPLQMGAVPLHRCTSSRPPFGRSYDQLALRVPGAKKNAVVFALEESRADDNRRHAIVTGANSGIGKATATELAKKGMVVTLACRNEASGKAVAEEIAQATNNTSVRAMTMDLGSLQSVRRFAAEYKETGLPLHVLVNNAGIMACPQAYTEDGFEKQLAVNHLGHFLLTALLIDNLIASSCSGQKSRVVVLASAAERIGNLDFNDLNFRRSRGYNTWTAYGQSKLANCLFSYELARRTRELGLPITSNSMHPGIVNTMLTRYILPGIRPMGENNSPISRFARGALRLLGLRSPEEGAATAVFLASSPEVENSSGLYYTDSRQSRPSQNAANPTLASRLWDMSAQLTGASQVLEHVGLTKTLITVS